MLTTSLPSASAEQRFPAVLNIALLATAVGLTAWFGVALTKEAARISSIWLPNGIVLAALLTARQRHWWAYLATGFAADAAANLASGDGPALSLLLSAANLFEVVIAAVPLRRLLGRAPDLSTLPAFLRFAAVGVVAAPATSGMFAAAALYLASAAPAWETFHVWALADGLGIAITTPIVLSLINGRIAAAFRGSRRVQSWLTILGAALTLALVFAQTRYPLLFFVPPVLFVVAVRLDFAGVAVITPILTGMAVTATVTGHGPFCLEPSVTLSERILMAQVFVLSGLLLSYFVAYGARERRAAQAALNDKHQQLMHSKQVLRESEALHRMLAENSSDIIVCSDLDGRRTYVSPAALHVLGFDPGELVGGSLGETIHPDDQHVLAAMRTKLFAGEDRQAGAMRCRHKDGHWVWLELRVRLARDGDGQPLEFVSNVTDITRRKLAEDNLAASLAELSLLAATDGLTGLPNRRELDRQLAVAWRRGLRMDRPLSLLMIDADHFKAYNDCYGHYQGDDALKAVAKAVKAAVRRPGDLAARYGGEEFTMLLPDTDGPGATAVAEKILALVRGLGMEHERNPAGIVTVSIGIACLQPDAATDYLALLVRADSALYEAKRRGRDCAVVEPVPATAEVIPLFARPVALQG